MPPEGRPAPGPVEHAPDPADTEASLLARAQAGDAGAFERLSGAYADRMFMLLLRLLGDRSEAEDVTQEVMFRAWQGITRFRGQSSYFTWLYRIAVNEASRALERRSRRPAPIADRARSRGTDHRKCRTWDLAGSRIQEPATVPELPRLLRDTVIPPPRRGRARRLHWPDWRRRHQHRAGEARRRWNPCTGATP
jgi:RNA polymerase sigma-70 factor, ECF subfamily